MADKVVNLFDKCAAECVHLYPEVEVHLFFLLRDNKMYTPSTIANL